MEIQGKVAIITGASSGIGQATSILLSQRGVKVVLVSRSEKKLNDISHKLIHSYVVPTDMSKEKEIVSMIQLVKKHFGKVDILINCAGLGYDASVEHINIDTFHMIFNLDVLGPVIAMQQVIPIMKKQKEGSIINISSGTARMALPNMSAYSSMKRALVGISLTAREELKKYNINVSVVYPYITDTNFEKNTIKEKEKRVEMRNDGDFQLPKADTAEYVANKILEAIENQKAEIFVHDWMKPQGR
jgi:short-subunit dehydrogenase